MTDEDDYTMPLETRRAKEMADKMFADRMASAGVSSSQIAQELLWFLPRDFVHTYSQVFYQAFAGKDDGGSGGRGKMDQAKAEIGKASGKGLQGLGGAKRKTHKKYWVIADERAVRVKDLADKRLRKLAREMKLGMQDYDREAGDRRTEDSMHCSNCRRFTEISWKFCPSCGEATTNE